MKKYSQKRHTGVKFQFQNPNSNVIEKVVYAYDKKNSLNIISVLTSSQNPNIHWELVLKEQGFNNKVLYAFWIFNHWSTILKQILIISVCNFNKITINNLRNI